MKREVISDALGLLDESMISHKIYNSAFFSMNLQNFLIL